MAGRDSSQVKDRDRSGWDNTEGLGVTSLEGFLDSPWHLREVSASKECPNKEVTPSKEATPSKCLPKDIPNSRCPSSKCSKDDNR
jgi:hypothetical protein